MNTRVKGFTLIELMIVVAIVGILAMIALPVYQDYLVRSRVAEGMAKLGEAKTSIAEFAVSTGAMPANANAAGIATGAFGQYIGSMAYAVNGATSDITVNFNDAIGVPAGTALSVSFVCSLLGDNSVGCRCFHATAAEYRYLPGNCRQDRATALADITDANAGGGGGGGGGGGAGP